MATDRRFKDNTRFLVAVPDEAEIERACTDENLNHGVFIIAAYALVDDDEAGGTLARQRRDELLPYASPTHRLCIISNKPDCPWHMAHQFIDEFIMWNHSIDNNATCGDVFTTHGFVTTS